MSRNQPFKKLTEEEEYGCETIFNTFDPQASGKIDTNQIADILICMDYFITPDLMEQSKKYIDKTGKGYFTIQDFKNIITSEFLYDFKFQPKIDNNKLRHSFKVFMDKDNKVNINNLAQSTNLFGKVQFKDPEVAQFKKDMTGDSTGGNLNVEPFIQKILG